MHDYLGYIGELHLMFMLVFDSVYMISMFSFVSDVQIDNVLLTRRTFLEFSKENVLSAGSPWCTRSWFNFPKWAS